MTLCHSEPAQRGEESPGARKDLASSKWILRMADVYFTGMQLNTGKVKLTLPNLENIHWPDGFEDAAGIRVDRVKQLVAKWPSVDVHALDDLPHHFIDGIHFLHYRASSASAFPLLLLHGWPGSFIEFLDVIPHLRERFHLVIPSLPGYGFSEKPREAGMSNARIAERMLALMQQLGYARFGVQGGDWGAGIATWMAIKAPDRVAGIHLNYIPGSYAPPDGSTSDFAQAWIAKSGAYGAVQRTRPLTLAYGLSDSPVGLLAWIAEKFDEWSDPNALVRDETVLLNTTIYWSTNTIYSSMRLYLESVETPLTLRERVPVPAAIAHFAHEEPFPTRDWIERGYDVQRWTDFPRGGHFAALECPRELAEDVAAFFG